MTGSLALKEVLIGAVNHLNEFIIHLECTITWHRLSAYMFDFLLLVKELGDGMQGKALTSSLSFLHQAL